MAQVINTNSLSLLTQNNLNKSQSSLGTAIERLSSGLRINSAKDDAAGQAIANRFTANIKGLTQASRNANDGISIAQTTEGALSEINNNLQRVRELSVQATNGTNSTSDLDSIQNEITQRLSEIDRVSGQTQFNGVKVLASDSSMKIQVGANDGETISIDLKEITSKTLGLEKLDLGNQISSKDLKAAGSELSPAVAGTTSPATTVKLDFGAVASSGTLEVLSGATAPADVGKLAVKVGSDYFEATYDPDTNSVTFDTTSTKIAGAVGGSAAGTTFVNANGDVTELSDLATASQTNSATAPTYTVYRNNTDGKFIVSDGVDTYSAAAIDLDSGAVTLGAKDVTTVTDFSAATEVSSGNVMTLPGSSTAAKPAVTIDMSDVNSAHAGTNTLMSRDVKGADGKTSTQYFVKNEDADGKVSYYNATADKTSGKITAGSEAVVDPLSAIDKALAKVDALRSDLGAVQNRFDSTITNLGNTLGNLTSARSRIEDADYATEVSNMSRAQILQQAGTSVLAQANQVPQGVLSLLR